MCINKIITYFRMDAPLLDLPNFARMLDCEVFSLLNQIPFFMKCQQFRHVFFFKGSAPIPPSSFSQCVKHTNRIIRKDMFFFLPCCVVLSESLMSRNKK